VPPVLKAGQEYLFIMALEWRRERKCNLYCYCEGLLKH